MTPAGENSVTREDRDPVGSTVRMLNGGPVIFWARGPNLRQGVFIVVL